MHKHSVTGQSIRAGRRSLSLTEAKKRLQTRRVFRSDTTQTAAGAMTFSIISRFMTADSNQRPLCLATQPVAQSAHTHTQPPPLPSTSPRIFTRGSFHQHNVHLSLDRLRYMNNFHGISSKPLGGEGGEDNKMKSHHN